MSDAAFKTAPFASYTTRQLQEFIDTTVPCTDDQYEKNEAMEREIVRRAKVAAGDVSVMTDGERLRHGKRT